MTTEPAPALGPREALGAVAVALLWALCYPLITTAVDHAQPLQVAALRALVAGAVLVAVSIGLGRPRPRGRAWLAVLSIGATATGLGFGGMFLAGGRVGPGLATVIANGQPLLAAGIGYFALGEVLRGWRAVGMVVAFSGIALIAAPALPGGPAAREGVSAAGIAFVLMGAVGVACGNVIMKRFASRLDALSATGWQLLVGSSVLLVAASPGLRLGSIEWTGPFILALVGLAVPGTAVAFALWLALLERAPLNALNVFSFLTPIFALAIGATFYGERLTALEVAGTCLVVAGAGLAARRSRSEATPAPDPADRA